jgi:5-methylcytosine-specific restriction endonuclease McrA
VPRLSETSNCLSILCADELCPLCGRRLGDKNLDRHHLIPRLKGGKRTELMHIVCHRKIHSVFSESELANKYNTVDALLEHEEIQKFVKWVKNRPIDYLDSSRLHNSRR